ncbi:HATPase_UhpB-NarQ-NarX-like domain containing protein [Candidatus Nanopelagicaceae bacterium]
MAKNQSLNLEIFTRALSSKLLPLVLLVNIVGTGFLFPTEQIFPGFNAHLSDAIAGITIATTLLLIRILVNSRTSAQLSYKFVIAAVSSAALMGTGIPALYGFFVVPGGVPRDYVPELLVFAPISIFGQVFTFSIFLGALKYATYTSKVLAEERLALKIIQENLREEVENSRAEITTQIDSAISPIITYLEADLKSSSGNAMTVEKIHLAINDVVRPLSHALDEQKELKSIGELDRGKVARQIRHSSGRHKLTRLAPVSLSVSPAITLTLFAVFDLAALLYLFDLSALFSVGLPFMLLSSTIFYLHLKLFGKRKAPAIAVLGIATLIAVLQGALFTTLGVTAGYETNLIAPIGFSVFLIIFAACWFELAVDRTRESRRKAELVNIEIASSISAVRQQLWYLRKKVARELHGGLQAKLQVLALQINKNQAIDPESLSDFYEQMKLTIETDPSDLSVQPFFEYANDLSEFWTGIADIKFSLNDAVSSTISSNVVLNECLREIIREAINNAIKHAGANSIEISLNSISESQLQLSVTNNVTKQSSGNSTTSLGSKIFEELSDSWNLSVGSDKSTLTAIFSTISHIS